MCVCVCVCVCKIPESMCMCVYVCACVCMYVNASKYVCVYVCACVCMYVKCLKVCLCMRVCVCAWFQYIFFNFLIFRTPPKLRMIWGRAKKQKKIKNERKNNNNKNMRSLGGELNERGPPAKALRRYGCYVQGHYSLIPEVRICL